MCFNIPLDFLLKKKKRRRRERNIRMYIVTEDLRNVVLRKLAQ